MDRKFLFCFLAFVHLIDISVVKYILVQLLAFMKNLENICGRCEWVSELMNEWMMDEWMKFNAENLTRIFNQYILNLLCLPGTVLSIICELLHLTFSTTQWGKYGYYLHFIDWGNWGLRKFSNSFELWLANFLYKHIVSILALQALRFLFRLS